MNVKSVLILCPSPAGKGGVADYYGMVKKYFHSDRVVIEFYYTGKSATNNSYFNRIYKSATDLIGLSKELRDKDLIVFNPSLDLRAVIRDGIFHVIAKKIFNKKTLVFFHGWNLGFEQKIEKNAKKLFMSLFCFDKGLVLASRFKNTFVRWGYDPDRVSLETTIFEHHEIEGIKDPFKIIFLSRFTRSKGCLEAIKAVEIVAKVFPQVKLYMAGDGELINELKEYVVSHTLGDNVEFTGWIEGDAKFTLLQQCGIMLFPTSYGEGMPISIIEGMGMGLSVVTRPVAGISDIMVDGENGFLVESRDPADFAAKVKYLIEKADIWQYISTNNAQKANEKYEIRNVVKRIEGLYWEVAQ